MIKAVIFDMDGLIINSEPFWQQAEKEVFGNLGIKLTTEMCEQTMGYRVDEVVEKWFNMFPWNGKSLKEVEAEIVQRVINLITEKGEAMPGFYTIIDFFHKKNFKIALASSSTSIVIDSVLKKLNIKDLFHKVCSAENEVYGKPHPAVFITTASLLNVQPQECIVLEDSFNGLIAAKAAKMKAIVVPFPKDYDNIKFGFADLRLRSLESFTEADLEKLNNS